MFWILLDTIETAHMPKNLSLNIETPEEVVLQILFSMSKYAEIERGFLSYPNLSGTMLSE
jgi:hypothetical protein